MKLSQTFFLAGTSCYTTTFFLQVDRYIELAETAMEACMNVETVETAR